MTASDIETRAEEVRALIEERLRIKGRTMDAALKKAGRLLPKKAHYNGRVIRDAMVNASHPKLRHRVEMSEVDTAHRWLIEHLKSIDPAERRKDRVLSFLGTISFNLIAVAAAFLVYLIWNGYV